MLHHPGHYLTELEAQLNNERAVAVNRVINDQLHFIYSTKCLCGNIYFLASCIMLRDATSISIYIWMMVYTCLQKATYAFISH